MIDAIFSEAYKQIRFNSNHKKSRDRVAALFDVYYFDYKINANVSETLLFLMRYCAGLVRPCSKNPEAAFRVM